MSYFTEGPEGRDTEYCEPHDEVKTNCAACLRASNAAIKAENEALKKERDDAMKRERTSVEKMNVAGEVNFRMMKRIGLVIAGANLGEVYADFAIRHGCNFMTTLDRLVLLASSFLIYFICSI